MRGEPTEAVEPDIVTYVSRKRTRCKLLINDTMKVADCQWMSVKI